MAEIQKQKQEIDLKRRSRELSDKKKLYILEQLLFNYRFIATANPEQRDLVRNEEVVEGKALVGFLLNGRYNHPSIES